MKDSNMRKKGTLIESEVELDLLIKKHARNMKLCNIMKTFMGLSATFFILKTIINSDVNSSFHFSLPAFISSILFLKTFDFDLNNIRIKNLLNQIKGSVRVQNLSLPKVIFFSEDYKQIKIMTVEMVNKENNK